MKKIIAMIMTIAIVAALLCACGEQKAESVTTSVGAVYDDGYAAEYASSTKTDENGNKVYEFSGDSYNHYLNDHKNSLGVDIQEELAANHEGKYGEYAYINDEKKAVIIGIHEEEYDAETAEAEAAVAAEYGFKYFQNLLQPVDAIRVIYCDAGNQSVEYGSFEFTAQK